MLGELEGGVGGGVGSGVWADTARNSGGFATRREKWPSDAECRKFSCGADPNDPPLARDQTPSTVLRLPAVDDECRGVKVLATPTPHQLVAPPFNRARQGRGRPGATRAAWLEPAHHRHPRTPDRWRRLLEDQSFEVEFEETGKLLLLDIPTFLSDEGILGSTAFLGRCLAHPSVLPRITQIWTTFRRYRDNLGAIVMTARHD